MGLSLKKLKSIIIRQLIFVKKLEYYYTYLHNKLDLDIESKQSTLV